MQNLLGCLLPGGEELVRYAVTNVVLHGAAARAAGKTRVPPRHVGAHPPRGDLISFIPTPNQRFTALKQHSG